MSITANLRKLEELFFGSIRYEIPEFQRSYVWEREKQWEPLWGDVETLAQSMREGEQPKPHFIGAVVLKQMDTETATIERRTVVDGQQRLTTLQLLIDAVREVLDERKYVNEAKRLTKLARILHEQGGQGLSFSIKYSVLEHYRETPCP